MPCEMNWDELTAHGEVRVSDRRSENGRGRPALEYLLTDELATALVARRWQLPGCGRVGVERSYHHAMGLREDLHALVDRIADEIERASADGWVDQNDSPLGKAKHLSLVKRGKLPGVKNGKQVLVRRSDLDAYLASQPVVVNDEAADEQAEADRLVAALLSKSRPQGRS